MTGPHEPGVPRTPRDRTGAALAWGLAAAVLFVACVVAVWGVLSLALDVDVLPPGIPVWAGPTAVVVAALVTFGATTVSVRGALDPAHAPRIDLTGPLLGGILAALAHALVLIAFAGAVERPPSDPSLVALGLRHLFGPFGLTVALLSAGATLGSQSALVRRRRGDSRSAP